MYKSQTSSLALLHMYMNIDMLDLWSICIS